MHAIIYCICVCVRNLCLISFSLAKFDCLSLTYFIWLNSSVSEAVVGAVAGVEFRSVLVAGGGYSIIQTYK